MKEEIVIQLVLFRDARYLAALVKSLRRQSFSAYKVFALDNCSGDDTGDVFKQLMPEGVLFHSAENSGFAGGHNFLLNETLKTGASYVVVLNTDVVLHDDFLWHLYFQIKRDERVGAVGPLICNPGLNFDETTIQNYRLFMNFKTGIKSSPDAGKPVHLINDLAPTSNVDYLSGVAMMIKCRLFDNMSFWDEALFMYGEERDFFYRLRQSGYYALVVKNAVCTHLHDWSSKNAAGYRSEYYYLRRNKVLYFKKYGLKSGLLRFLLMEFVKTPVVFVWSLRKGGVRMFYYYWLGILHGLTGRSGRYDAVFRNNGDRRK